MGIKKTIEVLNQMVSDRIIDTYAIGGAVAAYRYIEPSLTEYLDIIVSLDQMKGASGIVTIIPIVDYLKKLGYFEFRKEGILIDQWPVQFIPVSSPLDEDGLADAYSVEIDIPMGDSVSTRILTGEHLMAKAIDVGRPKDHARVDEFIRSNAFDAAVLCGILERHGLKAKWVDFCHRFGIIDPCNPELKQ